MIPEREFSSEAELIAHYRGVRARLGLSSQRPAPPEPIKEITKKPVVVSKRDAPTEAVEVESQEIRTAREIITSVASEWGMTLHNILDNRRDKLTVRARLAAIAAVRKAYPDRPVCWIAKQFQRNAATIHVALQNLGLKPERQKVGPSAPIGGRYRLSLSPEQVFEATWLYERGYSCKQIAALFDVCANTVGVTLKDHGVQLRPSVAESFRQKRREAGQGLDQI